MVPASQESQPSQKVTDLGEEGNTSGATRIVMRYAIAVLVIAAAWALTVLSLSFQMGTLAFLVLIVAVACVTGLVSPSDGPNVVANHGGIGLLVGAAATAPCLLVDVGVILVGAGAIFGGIVGICVGIFRSDPTLP